MKAILMSCLVLTAAASVPGIERLEAQQGTSRAAPLPPADFWNAATVYFLLTDRFSNGNTSNDRVRPQADAVLRSYQGGDLRGVTRKIEEGWFDSLGVTAIWLTPWVEQIEGSVNEANTGDTYGYHGYWTRDWTAVDPQLGNMDDLRDMVRAAHRRGIRVLMDAVLNHTGPETPRDPRWPDTWVRREPRCSYTGYATTVTCNLVETLPDILTESSAPVELPPQLVEKWRRERRLERETAELDAFFQRTGYPRAPRFYIIKWLTDWVRELGIDGYRVDTAKHIEETVSAELRREADIAFAEWKAAHPREVLDSLPFYMVGEVYGYGALGGRAYNFGDRSVDFFNFGYDALINFGFKHEAAGSLDSLFLRYSAAFQGPLRGVATLNYLASHDDGRPFDQNRTDALGAANRLLLSPGGAQIYYGDETARPLEIPGAQTDANLRSNMNWADLSDGRTQLVLRHWRKLGRFRKAHPAVGAGVHQTHSAAQPYLFSRTLTSGSVTDRVLVGMDAGLGTKLIPVHGVFPDGTVLVDEYSGAEGTVANGVVSITSAYSVVLLGERAEGSRAQNRAPVIVNVSNRHAEQMDVYVSAGGIEYRLGIVAQGDNRRFTLRESLVAAGQPVSFILQSIGQLAPTADRSSPGGEGRARRRVALDPVRVSPGNIVDVTITLDVRSSRAIVRP